MRYFPSSLRHGIEDVAEKNNISRWDVLYNLRAKRNPDFADELRANYDDTIYIGCGHGFDSDFLNWLNDLSENPSNKLPDRIIFSGDLPGAKNQRTILQKRLFYDNFLNRIGFIYKTRPDISAEELLDATDSQQTAESPTIREGAIRLLRFALEDMGEMEFEGNDLLREIHQLTREQMDLFPIENGNQLSEENTLDEVLTEYIHWIREVRYKNSPDKGLNSGTWVGTLPANIRQKYIDQYRETTESLSIPILKLKEKGVDIVWVEGNEDSRQSLEAMSAGLERIFDTQKFLEELGIECVKEIKGVEGEATYHLLLPYFQIYNFKEIPPEKIEYLKKEVEKARREQKSIIMVAHAQIDWGRHYPGQTAKTYNAVVIENLLQALELFKPDELVHPHQHWEMPDIPDRNAKFTVGQTVVSYLPLMKLGELSLPISAKSERQLKIFGGKRQPVRRIT